ncbi:YciI family protein [Wenyingzhuangia sp. IMCC45574]
MKKFMMIFIGASNEELGLAPEEIQERMGKWFAWNQKMQEQGILESGEALTPPVTRISGTERTITDNVAVESKELVGGYYVFKAENLEAAKKVTMDYPDYDLGGTVELREVMVFDN